MAYLTYIVNKPENLVKYMGVWPDGLATSFIIKW